MNIIKMLTWHYLNHLYMPERDDILQEIKYFYVVILIKK